MRYEAIEFSGEEKWTDMFLELPRRLYGLEELMQNEAEERRLLAGIHPLSHYFTIQGFLALDKEKKRAAARAVLTLYPGDTTAYIGYFECEENPLSPGREEGAPKAAGNKEAADCLFAAVSAWAGSRGYTKMTGPVNCSFWLGYRLKTDRFGQPYTGEPYNKEYYAELFQAAGFRVRDVYHSNRFGVIDPSFDDPKFAGRLKEKLAAGYEIKSPSLREFDKALRECYTLISRLYSDFPVYKPIDEDAFAANYSYLKYAVDCRMIKLAYLKGSLKGFFISVPNYKNLVCGPLTVPKLLKLLRIRLFPKDYVMLYMGVDEEHHGLGKALAEAIMRELKKRRACSVGALIHGDKVNGRYFSSLIRYEYHYALLEKKL